MAAGEGYLRLRNTSFLTELASLTKLTYLKASNFTGELV